MSSAPYGVRLLVGAATIAVEETRKLPRNVLMYPMTLASQAAHLVMLVQQNIAEVVIKGDSTLETLFPPKDEQPEWAVFDEDLPEAADGAPPEPAGDTAAGNGERRTPGRFALYSTAEGQADDNRPQPGGGSPPEKTPAVVTELNYAGLTLAQLRARLTSLSVEDLQTLLDYEESTKARAPFQTLLANRITRVSTK
ncbi:lipid droplet-associated protein [Mycolicibacillus parakoreensis]|uniref:Lipid droplet-associated protein n=1 Tax=Mycolicibacillus parakoreensis TaxID=1069221 RepID=A0ABY3U0Q3_9MYCO|nr:lipid droplet-associated protein [Mycolicibacillus parakoreensis]MCV7315101.1 lipid droplet-associated protein [Mycolicibacillus parakoreensis]ULN53549.1 lipid droplet-associated protein [Mycolicibacillus parakoreensis]HLR98833.1 lipid droplet-associated protein [Mycolicibacillus parakoreensis]